ncbi:hypothetical protein [Vibrio crassostreae]|uniref:hypothetical protein n=1 Tax=Vibrio crassostreae TaxID=246167 RepID=UPI002E18860F|nr:hypothetical protein [Vibrio crassostreae]
MKQSVFLSFLLMGISGSSIASELYYDTYPSFEPSEKGNFLVGDNKLALYTFKKDLDSPIPPKCTALEDKGPLGSCLARWPAAIVELSEIDNIISKDSHFGAVYNSEINELHLTYFGLPVYYWFKDTKEKNFTGDGVGKAWSLIVQGEKPIMFEGFNDEN